MSETAKQPKTSRIIARNTLFGVGSQFALKIASFAFNVLVVRALGAEHFGQYSIAIAWAGLFSVLGDLGISQYLSREIARDRSKAEQLFWDTVVLRFIFAVVSSIITTGGAVLAGYPGEIVFAIGLYTTTYFFQALLQPMVSILVGHERLDVTSVLWTVWQVLIMIFSALFLFAGLGFIWLVMAQVIVLPIIIVLHYRAIRRNQLTPPRFRINRDLWWQTIRAGLPFGIIQLSLSFAFQVDTIFLSQYHDAEVVGWYNAAYHLTLTILTISRAFNDAIMPSLAREHATNPDAVKPWYYTAVRFMMMIGLPIAIGGSLLSNQIIGFLYPELLPAAVAFAILVWDMPIVMYAGFCGNMTTSIKREGSTVRITVGTGLLNVVLNAIMVPTMGIIGACFATLLTDAFRAILFYGLFRREFGSGLQLKRLLRVAAAAAIMGVVVYLLQDFSFLVVIPISAVVYAALIWVSGAFTPSERSQIINLFSRRLRLVPAPGTQG